MAFLARVGRLESPPEIQTAELPHKPAFSGHRELLTQIEGQAKGRFGGTNQLRSRRQTTANNASNPYEQGLLKVAAMMDDGGEGRRRWPWRARRDSKLRPSDSKVRCSIQLTLRARAWARLPDLAGQASTLPSASRCSEPAAKRLQQRVARRQSTPRDQVKTVSPHCQKAGMLAAVLAENRSQHSVAGMARGRSNTRTVPGWAPARNCG